MTTTLAQKRLVFISGVEGSGTTMLSKWLGQPPFVACLTTSTPTQGYESQIGLLSDLSKTLWDSEQPPSDAERASLIDRMRNLPIDDTHSHVVWKRSTPFSLPRYRPLLEDISRIADDARLIVMKRSPIACAASLLRRKMELDRTEACARVRAAAGHLNGQLNGYIRCPLLVVPYDDVIADPHAWAVRLESWLGYAAGTLDQRTTVVGRPTAESQRLLNGCGAELADSLADICYTY